MIDLYLNALGLVPSTVHFVLNIMAFLAIMFGAGSTLAALQPLLERGLQGVACKYWQRKELSLGGPFEVPRYMQHWPTQEDKEWSELLASAISAHQTESPDFWPSVDQAEYQKIRWDFWAAIYETRVKQLVSNH